MARSRTKAKAKAEAVNLTCWRRAEGAERQREGEGRWARALTRFLGFLGTKTSYQNLPATYTTTSREGARRNKVYQVFKASNLFLIMWQKFHFEFLARARQILAERSKTCNYVCECGQKGNLHINRRPKWLFWTHVFSIHAESTNMRGLKKKLNVG